MFLLKTAWDNIFFHKKLSFIYILLISIASATILLFKGFVEYSERGMAIGFVRNSGHIEIAKKGFWDRKDKLNSTMDGEGIALLQAYLNSIDKIKSTDSVLNFQGMIGTEETSQIFWGVAYDDPSYIGSTKGEPVFEDDASLLLGGALFKSLDLKLEEAPQVNLMTVISDNSIEAGTFEVSGFIDTGIPQNDSYAVIASRSSLLKYFEVDDAASFLRVYLKNDEDVEEVRGMLNSHFLNENLPYETKDWKELNPIWGQTSQMLNGQATFMALILCILIFAALTQSISTSFMERIGEFGTMEAIGLKKSALITSLILEVAIIAIIASVIGVLIFHLTNVLTEAFNVKMTPPGYSEGYPLKFFLSWKSAVSTQAFIFFTCIVAVLYPIRTIKKLSSLHLMHYSGV